MHLRTRLTITFSLLTLLAVALMMLTANLLLERQFRAYAASQQEKQNQALVNTLNSQLSQTRGEWTTGWLEPFCQLALENRQILTIKDLQGTIIWDAHAHDNQHCKHIIDEMQRNTGRGISGSNRLYTEKTYPIMFDAEQVATLYVGSFGEYFLTDDDTRFISTLNQLFALSAVLFLILSLLLGRYFATRLSRPIDQACNVANRMAGGDYSVQMNERIGTCELSALAKSVNQLSESLARQEKTRSRLTRDMAHELRTPLTTLQSYLEAILDGIWEPDEKRIADCHDEVLRLSRLVSDLNHLSQYDDDVLVLNCIELNLEDVVLTVADQFKPRMQAHNLKLILQTEPCFIMADKDKICQILINLLENAIQYTAKGSITISLTKEDNQAVMSVKDTGMGIAAEHLTHIFDRFYRVDQARRRNTGGSGIGLSIAKAITKAHGGDISVISTENKGSCFTVRLPLVPGN